MKSNLTPFSSLSPQLRVIVLLVFGLLASLSDFGSSSLLWAAGDVSVFEHWNQTNGVYDLLIRGDRRANGVRISQLANGQYLIEGVVQNNRATTINGAANYTTTDVDGSVDIEMNRGADAVFVGGDAASPMTVPSNLYIALNGGSDYLEVCYTHVDARFAVEADSRPDTILLHEVTVAADLWMRGGGGDDTFDLAAVQCQSAEIYGGNHHDVIQLEDVVSIDDIRLAGNLSQGGGSGGDDFEFTNVIADGLYLFCANGDNQITMESVFVDDMGIHGGDGRDTITLQSCVSNTEIDIETGREDDTVTLQSCTATQDDFGIETGDGSDQVSLLNCESAEVYVDAGAHGDTVSIQSCTSLQEIGVYAGDGGDHVSLDDCSSTLIYAFMEDGEGDVCTISNLDSDQKYFDGGAGDLDTLHIGEGVTFASVYELFYTLGAGWEDSTFPE